MVVTIYPCYRRRLDNAGVGGVEEGIRTAIWIAIRRRRQASATAAPTARPRRHGRHRPSSRRGRKRRRRRARGGDVPPAALETAAGVLAARRHRPGGAVVGVSPVAIGGRGLVAAPPRLVPVVRELVAVADLLLLGEPLPAGLDVVGLLAPALADQLGDLGVREPRVLRGHLGLVVLAVEDEGCLLLRLKHKCQSNYGKPRELVCSLRGVRRKGSSE